MADTQRPGDGDEHDVSRAPDETAETTALPASGLPPEAAPPAGPPSTPPAGQPSVVKGPATEPPAGPLSGPSTGPATPGRGTAAPLGTVGDGRYRLTHRLGRGGMAEVFAAQDVRLARTVAVKLLRSELAQDEVARLRFTREAHAVAALNHHSIVAVYDTGEELHDGESTPFIVMELVEGRTVRELLVDEEAPPVDQALIIIAGVLEALAYSHRHGIVHRDIKPANVIITNTGAVKVMDFGIARALTGAASTMTQTGMVMGTPQYLSPEQALGKPVDHRSDLYAAGCMLFELLTLRPPFVGETPLAVVYQHVQDAPVPPSQVNHRVPPELDDLVLRSLAKNPDDRFQSADEFRAALQHALREMHGAAGAGYAAGAAAAAAAAAGLAAAGSGTGPQPGYEGTPGGTPMTTPMVPGAPADPTAVLPPYQSPASPYQTPAAPYQGVGGGGRDGGGGGYDDEEHERGRRGPLVWIAGAVLLVLAATVGVVLAMSGGTKNTPAPLTPTTSATTPSQAPSDETSPSPDRPSSNSYTPPTTPSTPPPTTRSTSPSPSSSHSATASSSPTDTGTPTEPPTSAPPTSAPPTTAPPTKEPSSPAPPPTPSPKAGQTP
ncbi:protein kinase [Kitasatospora sp. NPDC002227]|uniref:protein kinase domain-containing protein n=1 Tax=Kitasatospora sp. NPDC002227 TaxID=3154773 RepID=UPI0033176743